MNHLVVDVEPDNFPSIDQSSLCKLIRKRNTTQLAQFGGVAGVIAKLQTNAENGIKGDVDDIASRRNIFGSNSYRKPPAKTLQVGMDAIAEAFKDPIILILLVCAALSLGFGVHKDGLKGCSDGSSTFIAVFLVIAVSDSISGSKNNSTSYPKAAATSGLMSQEMDSNSRFQFLTLLLEMLFH